MSTVRVRFGCLLFRTAACLSGPQCLQLECVLGACFSGPLHVRPACVQTSPMLDPSWAQNREPIRRKLASQTPIIPQELRPWSRLTAAQIDGISRNSPSVREEQASPEETEIISLLVKAALLLVKKRFVRDVTFCDHVTLGESAGQTSKIGWFRLIQHLAANPHVPTFFRYFKPISVRMALLLACSPDLNDPHIGIYSIYLSIYIYIDRYR